MSNMVFSKKNHDRQSECPYGCCTPYNPKKDVKKFRRLLKRRERQQLKNWHKDY